MFLLFLAAGLFITLFTSLFLLFAPLGVQQTSPAGVTLDRAYRLLEYRLTEGEKAAKLAMVNRTAAEVIKSGVMIGLFLGAIVLFAGWFFIGSYAVPAAIAATILGIFSAEYFAQNEFKQWQEKLFSGVPMLVDFVPAFLEVKTLTSRDAIALTIPFLPEPLKSEMWRTYDRIYRRGDAEAALDDLAARAKHPTVEAITSRLATGWKRNIEPDIFDDLKEDIDDMKDIIASKATAKKGGIITLVSVFGLLGACLIYGYPAFQYMTDKMSGGLGI